MLFTVAVFSMNVVFAALVSISKCDIIFFCFSVQNAVILLLHYSINTSTVEDVFSPPQNSYLMGFFLQNLLGRRGMGQGRSYYDPRKVPEILI